jgi:hypothetical protein
MHRRRIYQGQMAVKASNIEAAKAPKSNSFQSAD